MARRPLNQRKRVVTVARRNPRRAAQMARDRRRVDPRITARQRAIDLQIAKARNKINFEKQRAISKAKIAAQKTASKVKKGAALRRRRGIKVSPKEVARKAAQQAARREQSGIEKAKRIEQGGKSVIQQLQELRKNPSQENVRLAQQIQGRISTKRQRQRASRAASQSAAQRGGVAAVQFATGGSGARTTGQQQALERFETQQAVSSQKTATGKPRQTVRVSKAQVVGDRVVSPSKVTFTGQVVQKPTKVKKVTKTASGQSLTQAQKDAQLKALQLDIQKQFPDAVAKATGLSTTQVRNLSIQNKTVVPTSTRVQENIKKNLTSEEKRQQLREAGLTPTEKKITVVKTPVVEVESTVPASTSNNVFDPNVSALTGVDTPTDKAQNLKDQGLAISPIGPDGRVTIVRSNGKLAKVSPQLAQKLANEGKIATGFDVETTIRSTESRPQPIDIDAKPLVSPTRDEIGAAGGTPQEKSKEQLRQETLEFRAGQSPNVTLFDIAVDRRSKGIVFGPGEKIGRRDDVTGEFVELKGTELAAVRRIREEQDIARIANALQAQKFQAISGAKSGVEVLAGLKAVEDRGEQQIIEPQFTFGTQQGPSDVPFFEDRERIGGVDTPEKLAAIQERLDSTPSPSLQETLGFGTPVTTVENKFIPREPVAEVTTGTEQKLVALGFEPTKQKIESGIIPKDEGSLVSVPNPTQTFDPVLSSVNQQFGGFDFLQANTQKNLAVQSLTKKPEPVASEGFSDAQFDIITNRLTPEKARKFQFTKEDSVVGADIGSPFGVQTGRTVGETVGIVLTGPVGLALTTQEAIRKLGGPQILPPQVRQTVGDFGTSIAADIENEFIAVANIPKLPGAVGDLATGRVGRDPEFIEFNPTIQDLFIGGIIQSGVSSVVERPIVSTPNAQGLVKAQLKDGTVIETTVQNAQRLADTNQLKTIGGGGAEQFKKENTLLFENLATLSRERPGALVGSGLEFGVVAITGAKAISFTAKTLKGAAQAGKASKAARVNKALSEELPKVEVPSEFNIKSTVSNVGEVVNKVDRSGADVLSGDAFGKGFKNFFKKQKSNYDRLTKTQKERLIKQVLERNKNLEKPLTRSEAEKLAKSAVNRRTPLGDQGLTDVELRTQEKAFRANQPIISTDTSKPLIARQFEFFRQKGKGLPQIEAGGGRKLGVDPRILRENQADEIFAKNLKKAIKEAEGKDKGGVPTTTKKKPPPPDEPKKPRTAGEIRQAFADANGISKKEAARQLDESGILGRSVDDSANVGGDSARKANNDIRIINDVKKNRISIDEARDILQSRETKVTGGGVQTLLSPEGKVRVVGDQFTGVLVGNKVRQVPTKIVRVGDDFARVPDLKAVDDLAKITNVGDDFVKLGRGTDDLASLTQTSRKALRASTQVLEEGAEGGAKKGGSKGGQQILKRTKIDEVPTLKKIRRASDDGIGKIPKALRDESFTPIIKGDLFGVITPKLITRTDEALEQDQTFTPALDIKQEQLPGQASLDLFGQPQRQQGQLKQPRFTSLRSQQAPRLANQFTFDFGQFQDPRTRGRLRFGGLFAGSSAQDVGGDARDNARRFFRVFDVGRDRQGNPVPFGRVSRGLGVQVQAAAPIFEVEDVLGRRRARRPRQEEVFDISFPTI